MAFTTLHTSCVHVSSRKTTPSRATHQSRLAAPSVRSPKSVRFTQLSVHDRKHRQVQRSPVVVQAGEGAEAAAECPGCGADEEVRRKCGCDGTGRIPGGMTLLASMANNGEVPPWFPIKAYRPCPKFIESGKRYESKGQSVDEIFFGGGTTTQDFLGGKDE